MEQEQKNYLDEMGSLIESVNSKEDLYKLTRHLARGYNEGFEEEQSVADYLKGYAALVRALDSWYKNQGLEMPEHPTWNMMGRILASAFIHS